MTLDTTSPRTRRSLLAGALGGAAALAAEALGRPLAVNAANGDIVHVGDDLTGTGITRIATTGDAGLYGRTSKSGAGVAGVYGQATAGFGSGVVGEATNALGGPIGVRGKSAAGSGTGVSGLADPGGNDSIGVLGVANNGGTGVLGRAGTNGGTGVKGEALEPGKIGLHAYANLGSTALKIEGKIVSNRSGRTLMAKNTSSKKINVGGVTSQSIVIAVLGSNRSGRYVRAVVSASGSFTVYLNTSLQSDAWINWFILN